MDSLVWSCHWYICNNWLVKVSLRSPHLAVSNRVYNALITIARGSVLMLRLILYCGLVSSIYIFISFGWLRIWILSGNTSYVADRKLKPDLYWNLGRMSVAMEGIFCILFKTLTKYAPNAYMFPNLPPSCAVETCFGLHQVNVLLVTSLRTIIAKKTYITD